MITRLDRLLDTGDLTPIRVRATVVMSIHEPSESVEWSEPPRLRWIHVNIDIPAELIAGRSPLYARALIDEAVRRCARINYVAIDNVDDVDWRLHGGRP